MVKLGEPMGTEEERKRNLEEEKIFKVVKRRGKTFARLTSKATNKIHKD